MAFLRDKGLTIVILLVHGKLWTDVVSKQVPVHHGSYSYLRSTSKYVMGPVSGIPGEIRV